MNVTEDHSFSVAFSLKLADTNSSTSEIMRGDAWVLPTLLTAQESAILLIAINAKFTQAKETDQ